MTLAPAPSLSVPPPRELFFHRKRHFWRNALVFLMALLILLGLFTRWPHYTGTAICQECGLRRDSFAWETRFFPHTLYRFSTNHSTSLSEVLSPQKSLAQHRHRWTSRVAPATASDRGLLYVVDAQRVAHFAEDISLYERPAVLTKWRLILLDPRYAEVMESSLHFMRFPAEGFSAAADFQAWWQKAEFPLWNHLRELTEPD